MIDANGARNMTDADCVVATAGLLANIEEHIMRNARNGIDFARVPVLWERDAECKASVLAQLAALGFTVEEHPLYWKIFW